MSQSFMNVSFSPPDISEVEINNVIEVLKSGWITTGPKTKLFENKISDFTHTAKTICLNSATSAMELTLRLLGIGPGDEVITSAYTYSASASVIDHVGAKIVLVDCEVNSFFMDYNQLEQAITEKTKVIISVDIAGVMCDYDRIFQIVESKKSLFTPENNLQKAFGRIIVLADAAHSFGSIYHGRASGEVADFTSFSFHAVKNLTTGEGGALTWKDVNGIDSGDIYNRLNLLSLHGQSMDALSKSKPGAWEYDILYPAYKCNMTDIMAGIGLGQLQRYPGMLGRRRELVGMYDEAFKDIEVESLQHYTEDMSSSGHLYLLRLRDKDECFRNYVIEKMAERGISVNVHYKPLPMHTAYKNLGFDIKDFPNAFNQYRNVITLPLYSKLTDKELEYVAENLKLILRGKHV